MPPGDASQCAPRTDTKSYQKQINGSTSTTPSVDFTSSSSLARTPSHGTVRSLEGGYAGGALLDETGPDTTTRRSAIRRTTATPLAVGETLHEEHEHHAAGEGEERVSETMLTQNKAYEEAEKRAELMYARFSKGRRRAIVAMVAFAGLLSPFCSSAFLPSITVIARDLNTTPTIVNVNVAVFIVVIGIVPLFWAPYAGVYGKKPIYMISLPIYTVGTIGVALSNSLAVLMVTRVIQGIGSSSVLSVGAGSIGDLYPRHERGRAMAIFYSGLLIGPAIAPSIAGLMTEYVTAGGYGSGWRSVQWLLAGMGLVASLLVSFVLPETAHVRGVDAIKESRRTEREQKGGKKTWREDWIWIWVNPLRPIKLLARPHILAISITSSIIFLSTYCILVPLSQTMEARFGITNTAILGCFYLAQGVGNYSATLFIGRYSDKVLRQAKIRRNGIYVPEDRLRACVWGLGIVSPFASIGIGWLLDKATGPGGLAGMVIFLILCGIGMMWTLTPLNTYCVDVMQDRSAEVIAINNAVRYIVAGAASGFVLPLIHAIGVGWTNTWAAFLQWIGFALVLLMMRYGPEMRAWHQPTEPSETGSLETVVAENSPATTEKAKEGV